MPPRRTRAAKAAQEAEEEVAAVKSEEIEESQGGTKSGNASGRTGRKTCKGRAREPEEDEDKADEEENAVEKKETAEAERAEESQARSSEVTQAQTNGKGKGKGKGKVDVPVESADVENVKEEKEDEAGASADKTDVSPQSEQAKVVTMEERAEKMKQLRKKMAESSIANRKAVAIEANKAKKSAKQEAAIARKMAKAEKILDERDAIERGDDVERQRALGYSIEENEAWEAKLAKKATTKDQGAIDPQSAAERTYRRQINQLKPDLSSYERQRASAVGADPSDAIASGSSTALTRPSSKGQVVKKDDLYGGINNLAYGDHKPDDAALDRVTQHLNQESDFRSKRSRYRPDDADAEVNYINDKNKHFNKKIKRFYDSYTQEIRENFERGTAL